MSSLLLAWPLRVLVGGGPPASRPRHELRSARRLEARPGRCVCWWAVPYPRMLLVVLVASLVLRVSSGLAAVCAGGLLAVRAASFARRVVSKPGLAPPPPTSTAARPAGPSGALHTSGARSL